VPRLSASGPSIPPGREGVTFSVVWGSVYVSPDRHDRRMRSGVGRFSRNSASSRSAERGSGVDDLWPRLLGAAASKVAEKRAAGRQLADVDGSAAPPPSDRGEPSSRLGEGPERSRGVQLIYPSVEPHAGASGIYRRWCAEVLPKVEEDIGEGATHLGRSAEGMRVISVRPDGPPPGPLAIEGPRTPPGEALEAADERSRGVAFDDQVEMIDLHREMQNAEPRTICQNDGPPERLEGSRRSQGREPSLRTQRHVDRPARFMRLTPNVRRSRSGPRLWPRPGACAAPSARCR
jgi:hypothetical protein